MINDKAQNPHKFWILCFVICRLSLPCFAELSDRDTLKGITKIGVDVLGLTEDVEKAGLRKEEIQAAVENQLRSSGIKVLPFKNAVDSELAFFLVRVDAVQAYDRKGKPMPLYALWGQVEVKQAVSLLRDPIAKFAGVTWSRSFNSSVDMKNLKASFYELLSGTVENFAKDYLEVNR